MRAGRFHHVVWVNSTGSTNADLADAAHREPRVPRVLFTDYQTAGRGRLDRTWEQPSGGGLMVSFFVPWTDARTAHVVPTALGVSVVDAIASSGRSVGLKWPNDVVVGARSAETAGPLDGKKLGGMLSSTVSVGTNFAGVVVGLGCNVAWPPPNFAELPDAAALDHLPSPSGDRVDRYALAADLVRRFDEELTNVQARGAEHLADRYRLRCVTIGQDVRITVGSDVIDGRATDVDPSGALLVDIDGRQKRIDVGDVTHLRPHRPTS